MKNELTHIGPLLRIGLICLLVVADTIYVKSINSGYSFKSVTTYTQNTTNRSFFIYVVENSLAY
jgi:uncharacterized membrane protein